MVEINSATHDFVYHVYSIKLLLNNFHISKRPSASLVSFRVGIWKLTISSLINNSYVLRKLYMILTNIDSTFNCIAVIYMYIYKGIRWYVTGIMNMFNTVRFCFVYTVYQDKYWLTKNLYTDNLNDKIYILRAY